MAQLVGHATDLAVAPFPQFHLQQGVPPLGCKAAHHRRLCHPAFQGKPMAPMLETGVCWTSLHPNPVGLRVAVAGMGELQGEMPLVGEQQRTAAVGIKASDRVQAVAKIGGEKIKHDGACTWVVTAADDPFGFIEQEEPWWVCCTDRLAVNADVVSVGVGFIAELSQMVVDADAALTQKIFCMASGANPCSGDHFLQALAPPGVGAW